MHNVAPSTIRAHIKKHGLKANLELAQQRNSEKHTVYTYDIHYFDKIDTMDKAYILGFLCADGYVTDNNEVGITVAEKDRDMVEFYKSQLKTNKNITIIEQPNGGRAVELRVHNRYLASKVKEYGILPRKSLTINIGEVIKKAKLDEKQTSVFLLGYFDGDGSISLCHNKKTRKEFFSMSITGTFETVFYYLKYFDGKGSVTKRHKDRDNNNYSLQYSNNYKTIYDALSKLYKYSDELTFHYKRKHDLFNLLKTKVKS